MAKVDGGKSKKKLKPKSRKFKRPTTQSPPRNYSNKIIEDYSDHKLFDTGVDIQHRKFRGKYFEFID